MAITDLTNTTWYVPVGWEATAGYGYFYVTGTVNNNYLPDGFRIGYLASWDFDTDQYNYVATENTCCYQGGNYYNNYAFTINITGGTDVTNTSLISWLKANGTLTSHTMA